MTYTVVLKELPMSLQKMLAMEEASLKEPHYAAALTIAALVVYPIDKNAACEMLEFLQGPKGLSTYDKQFIADRFRDKDYVPRSYFEGSTPENGYEPEKPYTITFFENLYSHSRLCLR